MSQDDFFLLATEQATLPSEYKTKTLWLNKNIQTTIKKILGHQYPKLRIRYKINSSVKEPTSIWYLSEIGKERPISFGIAVKNARIQLIRVLVFRESRGYEIKIPTFSKQFKNAELNKNNSLDKNIDGITGATMSVNAMKKIARVALLLHKTITLDKSVESRKSTHQKEGSMREPFGSPRKRI